MGVDLFFVLSGFLITCILLGELEATGSISLVRFYTRRALRLLPALFLMVGAVTLFSLFFQPDQFWMTVKNDIPIIFYVWNWVLYSNYGQDGWTYQWVYGHLWSLSVEEQFYILWPFVLLAVATRRKISMKMVLIAGVAVPAIARILFVPVPTFNYYFRTDLHFDGLMWGATGAWLVFNRYTPTTESGRSILGVAGALGLALFVGISCFELFHSGFVFYGGWTLLDALAMLAIVSLANSSFEPFKAAMEFGPLKWTGKISYGLYLWHLPIFYYCRDIPVHESVQSVIAIAMSYAVASASYYGVERHFLSLKDRFAAKHVSALAVPQSR